jgi:hypothetical protein
MLIVLSVRAKPNPMMKAKQIQLARRRLQNAGSLSRNKTKPGSENNTSFDSASLNF